MKPKVSEKNCKTVSDYKRRFLNAIRSLYWQTDTFFSWNSWGYIFYPIYKTPVEIVADLVDVVGNDPGCCSFGLKAEGINSGEEVTIMLANGDWSVIKDEAILRNPPMANLWLGTLPPGQ